MSPLSQARLLLPLLEAIRSLLGTPRINDAREEWA